MAQVKLALREKDAPELVQYTKSVAIAMADSNDFPTPNPPLSAVTAKNDELEAKIQQRDALEQQKEQATTEIGVLEAELSALLTQLGNYVQTTSNGDAALIQSAGMETRADSAPITEIDRPSNLSATIGDDDGEIDLDWDNVRGVKSYEVQMSTDAASWQHGAIATKSKTTVDDLASGTKFWFRVRAIGSNTKSPWSDPAQSVAP